MVVAAPSVTREYVWFHKDRFRSLPDEVKEIKSERRQRLLNLNGYACDVEEMLVVFDKAKSVRYVQQLSDVVKFIDANVPDNIAKQARPYINELNRRLTPFEFFGLPPFSVSLPEDETMLMEWDFEHFTIGISFEPNPENSSWYIVNDGRIKGTTGWGFLNSKPISEIIKQFIDDALGGLNAAEW